MSRIKNNIRLGLRFVRLSWMYSLAGVLFHFLGRLVDRCRYFKIKLRIRRYPDAQKIKVIFLVSNISKWKTQSLYNAFKNSKRFRPIVLITILDDERQWKYIDVRSEFERQKKFYEGQGCVCDFAYDPQVGELKSIVDLSPDIVFFQEPYYTFPGQCVKDIKKVALCCYVPYGVEYEQGFAFYKVWGFHNFLYLNVTWCEERAKYLKRFIPWYTRAGTIKALGHTIFDLLKDQDTIANGDYVIYAPHFSFPITDYERPSTISTFMWSGRLILAFAQKHPEIKWAFKPHPRLRTELIDTGGWSKSEVDAYYQAWETIGTVCYTSDYIQMFRNSRVLITDSASFLLEYPVTGHPVIHLKLSDEYPLYDPYVRPLLSTYYIAKNPEELKRQLKLVVEDGVDPNKDERITALHKLNMISEKSAARNIVDYLSRQIHI